MKISDLNGQKSSIILHFAFCILHLVFLDKI